MPVEMVFRASISHHGKGRYIIYIPNELAEKARRLYESDEEVIVIVLTGG